MARPTTTRPVACPTCGYADLDLHQPEVPRPDKLLGTRVRRGGWHAVGPRGAASPLRPDGVLTIEPEGVRLPPAG